MTLFAALLLAVVGTPPQTVLAEHEDELLAFRYGWPAIVEEEPALRAMLRADKERARSEARENAAADRASRGTQFPFTGHSFARLWEVIGANDRLLSLAAETNSYSGGAHGNVALEAILWDRASDHALEPTELLGRAAMERMAPRFCDALDAMRAERRGEPVRRDPNDSFTACPALADQALAPVDEDGDGRLDGLRVLIPPYAAGPWVEGPYIVELGFALADLSGLAAEHRASFEPAE